MTPGMITTNVNGIELVVPETFEGILPPSPHHKLFDFEPHTFIGLKSCLNPGDVVFDVGSSYGIISALMAKIVGPSGKVISFEANLDAMEKSREIIIANGLEPIIDLNNYLVGNYSQDEMDFYVIPSFESVASSINSDIPQIYPKAVKKMIRTMRIDDFCSSKKIFPKCIKIDTEGAEFVVVNGMKNLIESNFPDMVIETHGAEIENIGGNLKELISMLESFGYGLFDLQGGKKSGCIDYVSKYFKITSTLLASNKVNDENYVRHLQKNLQPYIKEDKTELLKKESMGPRVLAERGFYNEILNRFMSLPLESKDAIKQYYLALALDVTGLGPKEALVRYTKALNEGFPPFWVYYHRAFLYQKIGDAKKALDDLIMAERYNKSHPGVKILREKLRGLDISQEST